MGAYQIWASDFHTHPLVLHFIAATWSLHYPDLYTFCLKVIPVAKFISHTSTSHFITIHQFIYFPSPTVIRYNAPSIFKNKNPSWIGSGHTRDWTSLKRARECWHPRRTYCGIYSTLGPGYTISSRSDSRIPQALGNPPRPGSQHAQFRHTLSGFTQNQLDTRFIFKQRKVEADLATIEARTIRENKETRAKIATLSSGLVTAAVPRNRVGEEVPKELPVEVPVGEISSKEH